LRKDEKKYLATYMLILPRKFQLLISLTGSTIQKQLLRDLHFVVDMKSGHIQNPSSLALVKQVFRFVCFLSFVASLRMTRRSKTLQMEKKSRNLHFLASEASLIWQQVPGSDFLD
jgi:hypothetical protein